MTDEQIEANKQNNKKLEQSLETTDLASKFVKLRNNQIKSAMILTKELIDELAGHSYQRSTEFLKKYEDLRTQINETKL